MQPSSSHRVCFALFCLCRKAYPGVFLSFRCLYSFAAKCCIGTPRCAGVRVWTQGMNNRDIYEWLQVWLMHACPFASFSKQNITSAPKRAAPASVMVK